MMRAGAAVWLGLALGLPSWLGCSSSTIEPEDDVENEVPADALKLTIGPHARTFVELAGPSQIEVEGAGAESIAWDIAFQGHDVFTNGGVSGPGSGSAFGPLSAPTFLSDTAPDTPIMLHDRTGGALLDWYDYSGDTHQLYSRYHVYGLRDGERLFKLQVLGYYAEQLGAPVDASYHVRYAEVLRDGSSGETHEVTEIDASAGGSKEDDSQPSACLELDSERVTLLTPDEAALEDTWQLCFRRDTIAVNGGRSGPRGVAAVDLQSAQTAHETEEEILARTAESELAGFDATDFAALDQPGLGWREDGVVTAFAERWLEPGSDPLALSDTVWFVIAADGAGRYLLQLDDLFGDPATGKATLSLRAKSVR
jgi:hypothetical protein